jgi:ADP-ribose pyrophosphatase
MLQQFTQNDVEIVAEESAYKGFFSLKKLTIKHRLFNGGWSQAFQRELCVRGDAVGVLLYDPHTQQFAMVEQLRIGVLYRKQSPWLLELVAGMLDKDGEDCAEVARRETQEEAGLEIGQLEPVIEYFCSPGGSTEYFTLFCGKVNLAGIQKDVFGVDGEHEDICLHILPVTEVLEMLNKGFINNAMSIIALQWFQLNKSRLDTLWLR